MDAQDGVSKDVLVAMLERGYKCALDKSNDSIHETLDWIGDSLHTDQLALVKYSHSNHIDIQSIYNSGIPEEWIHAYTKRSHQDGEQVLGYPDRGKASFMKLSEVYRNELDIKQYDLVNAARKYNLSQGVVWSLFESSAEFPDTTLLLVAISESDAIEGFVDLIAYLLPVLGIAISANKHVNSPLSNKEMEILGWTAKGKTAWEVGQLLCVSEPTIKFHLSNIYKKLNVTNKVQAVRFASEMSWI